MLDPITLVAVGARASPRRHSGESIGIGGVGGEEEGPGESRQNAVVVMTFDASFSEGLSNDDCCIVESAAGEFHRAERYRDGIRRGRAG